MVMAFGPFFVNTGEHDASVSLYVKGRIPYQQLSSRRRWTLKYLSALDPDLLAAISGGLGAKRPSARPTRELLGGPDDIAGEEDIFLQGRQSLLVVAHLVT